MAVEYSLAVANARLTEVDTAAGAAAYLQVWKGAIPLLPETDLTGRETDLMASLAMTTTNITGGGGSIANGVLTCGPITSDTSAAYGGTPTFVRIATNATGVATGVCQMTAGTPSGNDVNFDDIIYQGGTVAVSSLAITDASYTPA